MDLTVPLASGALFAAANSWSEEGSVSFQGPTIKNGIQQAVVTAAAPSVVDQVNAFGINLPIDREFSEPLITAVLYYLADKIMGAEQTGGRTLLFSAGAAYAAKKVLGPTKNIIFDSQVTGSVVPAFGRTASRVTG